MERRYHTITFTIPEAANAFVRKAMVRSLVQMNGVEGMTVHMQSDGQVQPHHIKWIQSEAEAQFGFVYGWKFNLSTSPVSLCGNCGKVLKTNEIEDGFCATCLDSAVGE